MLGREFCALANLTTRLIALASCSKVGCPLRWRVVYTEELTVPRLVEFGSRPLHPLRNQVALFLIEFLACILHYDRQFPCVQLEEFSHHL